MNSLTSIYVRNLPESTRLGVPTMIRYITTSGKEVLKLLQSAVGVLPVPLLQDTIGIVIKIVEVCEVC